MHRVDLYFGPNERERRQRRRKWILPLLVGVGAAIALTRERPRVVVPTSTPTPKVEVRQPDPLVTPPTATTIPVIATETTATTATTTSTPPPPAPAHLAATPARIDFGEAAPARGIAPQLAMIRNDGALPLAHLNVRIAGPFLLTSGCPAELAAGAQCAVAIAFTPKQAGSSAGTLHVTADGQRAQIPLRGSIPRPPVADTPKTTVPAQTTPPLSSTAVAQIVVPPPKPLPARLLCFEPAFVRFIKPGIQKVTLINPEPAPLTVVAVVPLGRTGEVLSGYDVRAKECLRVLAPRQRCRFTIAASTRALEARETMLLAVYYDDPATGTRRAAQFSSACNGR
ncbi:MAG: choice-of-anchor D domain-containing protein [Acidobacteria bacterium]|nr:choice-of-anchor D domain-containing protein [Acidobacteriota bacterium]MBV9474619.1 choice-of-anchor D domain-containing protein [Acidobacteriota bacterium]